MKYHSHLYHPQKGNYLLLKFIRESLKSKIKKREEQFLLWFYPCYNLLTGQRGRAKKASEILQNAREPELVFTNSGSLA